MAVATYPYDQSPMNMADWQRMRVVENPDRVTGLQVTSPSPLVLRMGVGSADVGGVEFANSANYDISTTANLSSGTTRIDRLVLRLTFGVDGSVDVVPVIVSGLASSSPTGPSLASTLGPGTYEVPVARWAIVFGSTAIQFLTNDGPGPGAVTYTRGGWTIPNNSQDGVYDLVSGTSTYRTATGSWGPEPASVSGAGFQVTIPGLYTVSLSVLLTGTGAAAAVNGGSPAGFVRLALPGEDSFADFSAFTARARVAATSYVPAGYLIRPYVYQNSGVNQLADVTIKLSRSG